MELRKVTRSVWVKPTLIQKRVQETLSGIGFPHDGISGEFAS